MQYINGEGEVINVFDYSNVMDGLLDYVGQWANDYDLNEVMDELRANYPEAQSIEDVIGIDEYLYRHMN